MGGKERKGGEEKGPGRGVGVERRGWEVERRKRKGGMGSWGGGEWTGSRVRMEGGGRREEKGGRESWGGGEKGR